MSFHHPAAKIHTDPEAQEVLENARARVEPLAQLWGILQAHDGLPPSIDFFGLLASCYLQGVRDSAEALAKASVRPKELKR